MTCTTLDLNRIRELYALGFTTKEISKELPELPFDVICKECAESLSGNVAGVIKIHITNTHKNSYADTKNFRLLGEKQDLKYLEDGLKDYDEETLIRLSNEVKSNMRPYTENVTKLGIKYYFPTTILKYINRELAKREGAKMLFKKEK